MKNQTIKVDLTRYTEVFGIKQMPYMFSEIFSQHYRTLGCLLMYHQEQWSCWLPKATIVRTLRDGERFLSDARRFARYRRSFRKSAQVTTAYFRRLLKKRTIRPQEIIRARYLSGAVFRYYIWTEWFYTDRAYTASKTKIALRRRLRALGRIKNWARGYLNRVYLGQQSFVSRMLMKATRQFGVPLEDLVQYNLEEVLALFDDQRVSQSVLRGRRRAYLMAAYRGRFLTMHGRQAVKLIAHFETGRSAHRGRILLGTSANPGRIQGTVKILNVGYANYDTIHRAVAAMKPGQILVANTTSPELMAACRKAAAIVTNEGGLLSHAAIVSRELGIPCVVGVGEATSTLRNGDLVEVDAHRGLVKIIKRAK